MEFENKKLRDVAEVAARIMMGEKALHPNQQKLDVHEPEKDKLTSDDFKKLRSMKKEEIEDVSEMDYGGGKNPNAGHGLSRDDDDDGKKQLTAKVAKGGNVIKSALDILNKQSVNKKDLKKEEVDLEEARSTNLHAGGVGNEVHMSKWMQDHTKKNKSTGTPDSWNEYHGKGTVTHLGKDGHVKVKSHDTGKTHKFSYYGKGIGPDSEDMAVHKSKDDIHSLRNVKEEVDLDESKMAQLDADLKDLSHADFHKEYGKPKSHYDPSNFKKPVQKGKEMDRVKSLAQRAMASMKKEEVEDVEEGIVDKVKSVLGQKPKSTNLFDQPHVKKDSADYLKKSAKQPQGPNNVTNIMNKEEVEELEEMFPGTPEYEKKYGKVPQDMKKGEKKKTSQGEMEKTEKGVVHKRKFSEMVESYTEGGIKGFFKTINEEPTNAEFTAQLDDAKKRAAGTKKQPEVSKPAVQAVQEEEVVVEGYTLTKRDPEDNKYKIYKKHKLISTHDTWKDALDTFNKTTQPKSKQKGVKEEVESFEEETHTTVEFVDYNDVNGVKVSDIDLAERKLTDAESDKKEEIVKSMKKGLSGFKERYGKDAKSVMYATATARAKGE